MEPELNAVPILDLDEWGRNVVIVDGGLCVDDGGHYIPLIDGIEVPEVDYE